MLLIIFSSTIVGSYDILFLKMQLKSLTVLIEKHLGDGLLLFLFTISSTFFFLPSSSLFCSSGFTTGDERVEYESDLEEATKSLAMQRRREASDDKEDDGDGDRRDAAADRRITLTT
ncbi:hypothetical protein E2542_SST04646 [Spatholobus suberectus]|nr:hypothetical protein E2542_SST04646 [Spatholobus suberectus]